jgi:hypothetical protein
MAAEAASSSSSSAAAPSVADLVPPPLSSLGLSSLLANASATKAQRALLQRVLQREAQCMRELARLLHLSGGPDTYVDEAHQFLPWLHDHPEHRLDAFATNSRFRILRMRDDARQLEPELRQQLQPQIDEGQRIIEELQASWARWEVERATDLLPELVGIIGGFLSDAVEPASYVSIYATKPRRVSPPEEQPPPPPQQQLSPRAAAAAQLQAMQLKEEYQLAK